MDSESSSTTNSCAICGKFARQHHHGALSCRGCSAFFRRAATTPNLWTCKRGNGKCDVTKMNEPPCKKCRLSKCYSVGMNPKSFRFDRNAMVVTDELPMSPGKNFEMAKSLISKISKIPPSIEIYLGRPHIFIKCEPDAVKNRTIFLDFYSLIDKASEMLYTGQSRIFENGSCLESLSSGLASMRISKSKKKVMEPKTLRYIGKHEQVTLWEYDFLRTTKWLTYFEEFQKLPHNLKLDLIKTIWQVFGYLERLSITADKKRLNECSEKEVMINNEVKVDIVNLNYDISWCSSYTTEQLMFFTKGDEKKYLEQLTRLFVELNPSSVELNFILIQVCFTYAARYHQGEIMEAMERLQATVSNEIHNYYVDDLQMPNYAGRLANLLKADKLMQMYLREKKKKIEVARLFDIFEIVYSHPEMFHDNVFC